MSRPSQLSRDKIAATALDCRRRGLRIGFYARVRKEMGVGTMSLYYYLKTKADLIAAMDDALMGEVLFTVSARRLARALTVIAFRTRDVFLRHPWVLSSMLSASPASTRMRHMTMPAGAAGTTMTTRESSRCLQSLMTSSSDMPFAKRGATEGRSEVR